MISSPQHRHTHHTNPFEEHLSPHHQKKRFPLNPRQKKVLCVSVFIIGLLLFTEITSWLCISLLERQWMTYGKLHALLERASTVPSSSARADPYVDFAPHDARIVHPYLGFVTPPRDNKENTRTHGVELMEQYGFDVGSGPLVRERRADTIVIGIFGGSVAKQFWERSGTAVMAEMLKKYPPFAGKNIIISSAAFYSFRQPQELLALNYVLSLGGKFDILLEIDGFNEMHRLPGERMNGWVSPFYPYGWAQYMRILEADPTLRLETGRLAVALDRRSHFARIVETIPLRWSMTAGFIWSVFDYRMERSILRQQNSLLEYRQTTLEPYLVQGPVPHYDSEAAYYADRASVWEEGSRQMHIIAKGNNIRYFHFLQPNGYNPDSKPLTSKEKRLLIAPLFVKDVTSGFPLLRQSGEKLKAEGVVFTDLTNIFKDRKDDIYVDDCCHMNPLGNAIMAKYIAETILRDLEREPLKQ